MLTFVTIVHVLLCVFMIFVILLQPGKDAGMGSALGGGAATSAFGGRGATTFLTKITGICAAMFFITSLGLSFVGMRTSVAGSLANKPAATQPAPAPQQGTAQPGAGAPPAGQVPPANPQEAAPPTGSGAPAAPAQQTAPAAPGSVEQPRPAEAPAPAPGQ